jgi:hypothetical protein
MCENSYVLWWLLTSLNKKGTKLWWDWIFEWNCYLFNRYYGGLNMYSSHQSMQLNTWPIGSGIIRRCGLVGGSVLLWCQNLRSPILKIHSVPFCCHWIKMWNSQLLLQNHYCLPASMLPNMMKIDSLWNCKTAPLKCFFFIRVAMVMILLHSNTSMTKTEVGNRD